MSKYPPPIATLPIFDPKDFNTTLNNGSPISYVNSQIETQQLITADIGTLENNLFTLSDLGDSPVYNTNNPILDSANKNYNTPYTYNLGGDASSLYPAGVYLVNCSVSVQTTSTPIMPSYIQITDSNGTQSCVFYCENLTVSSFDMNATFVATFTVPTNIVLTIYVGTTSAVLTYKINTTGGNLINTSVIKLK